MIHEEICTYEVCKLAKEKGFGEMASCYQGYRKDGTLFYFSNMPDGKERVMQTDCLAPTQSLLQRWLRDNHEADVWVSTAATMATKNKRCYYWHIAYDTNNGMAINIHESMVAYSTYEEALEEGLEEALIVFV